jgi:sugar lactone lactonase YvrE
MLAVLHAERGEKKEALRWLERLVEIKWTFVPDDIDFAALKGDPAYREISAKLAKNEPVVSRSAPAFSLPEKDFIPEGIAYDPKERTFYLGSLYKRKIVAVGKDKAARDFTSEAQDGLFAVLGMKVDAPRRHLWVASVAFPTMKGFTPDMNGKAALFQYDLGTRKLIAKLEPPSTGAPSLLNDIAINAKGDVFVTDSTRGGVYVARKGEGKLTDLVPPDKFRYPNGVVLSKDEKSLFVAHFRGMSRVDAATGEEARLEAAKGIVLSGIDGMALYEGSLVAVQNGFSRGRVTRFFLDKAGARVEREEILESGSPLVALPTTGAVADGAFYYIANSQLRSFDADKRILPLDALKESVVLKAPLGR